MNTSRRLTLAIVLPAGGALVAWLMLGNRPPQQATTLRILVADSLARPLGVAAKAFEQENPDVRLYQIPCGSVLAARRIREGNDRADVLAVADQLVIDELLRPEHADWYAAFATNQIGIAYTDASAGAAELNSDRWWNILTRDKVKVAAANPFQDPCGYWTELCWQLADRYYPPNQRGGSIAAAMHAKCGEPDSRRSDTEQILQLLEAAGGLDYVFVYRSQALQHNLPFLRLPDQINLGAPDQEDFYRQAEVSLPARGPQKPFRKRGTAIVYALTIPRSSEHSVLAARYLQFLLGPRGRALLTAEYLDALEKPWTCDVANVPEQLRPLLQIRPRRPATAPGTETSHDR